MDTSSARLLEIVRDLPDDVLGRQSFARDWSIAQVLSHLGSGAEICARLIERGRAGDLTPPSAEEAVPVWRRWDAMPGPAQREAWYKSDRRHRDLMATLRPDDVIPYFAGPLRPAEYAGYRLSEQAVHAWDIEVALTPSATIPEAELLWERLDLMVSRFHDATTRDRLARSTIAVPGDTLQIGDEVHLTGAPAERPDATVEGHREAVLRLFYGRNRPQDGLRVTGTVGLDDLRRLFPGI